MKVSGEDDPDLAEFLKKTKPSPYYHWEFGITDNYNLSKTELFKVFQESQYFKFTFVRNPFDKLVSAYANKIMASPSQNSYYQRVAKQIKEEGRRKKEEGKCNYCKGFSN
jgi:hypothetical protein